MLNDRDFQSLLGMLPFREHISPAVADSLRTHSTIKDWYAGEVPSEISLLDGLSEYAPDARASE